MSQFTSLGRYSMCFRVARLAFAGVLLGALGCGDSPFEATVDEGRFTIVVHTAAAVAGVSVEVSADDIPTPIVENLPFSDEVASGTIHIPAGGDRLITVHAYDENAIETHRGSETVDVHPGTNLTVTILVEPLTGDVPIVATVTSYTVTLLPTEASIPVGETILFEAIVEDADGPITDPAIAWGSTNPTVATVDTAGLTTAHLAGTAIISATYRGVVALAELSVTSGTSPLGRMVFSSDRDGNNEIYSMNEDGSSTTNLTNDSADDQYPEISPDGSRVAFVSDRGGSNEIHVMDIDGSNVVNVSADASATESDHVWSPDGSRLAYGSSVPGNIEIYVVNTDGSVRVNITNNAALDMAPAWSPDGNRIAFVSNRSGNFDIWVMNSDGTSPTQLTTHTGSDLQPDWSPDGTQITYLSQPTGATYTELTVMNADGTGITPIISPDEAFSRPTWSPDGSLIGFLSWVTGNYEVYTINPNGTNRQNVTNSTEDEMSFKWSPDGGSIVFDRQVGIVGDQVDVELFTILLDGSGLTNVTNNPAFDSNPSWGPPPPP